MRHASKKSLIIVAIGIAAVLIVGAWLYTNTHQDYKPRTAGNPFPSEDSIRREMQEKKRVRMKECGVDCSILHSTEYAMYYTKGGSVYYRTKDSLEDVYVTDDVESFEVPPELRAYENGFQFARDSKSVYLSGMLVPQATPETFRLLGNDGYASDDTLVFHFRTPIPESDPTSFAKAVSTTTGLCSYCITAYDDFALYVNEQRFPFKTADKHLVVEKPITPHSRVYELSSTTVRFFVNTGSYKQSRGRILTNADPDTFFMIDRDYARDGTNVYLRGERVDGADARTFTMLPYKYARDSTSVFLNTKLIVGADPESFVVLDAHYAKDATHLYSGGTMIPNIGGDDYTILSGTYVLDNQHVYACMVSCYEEQCVVLSNHCKSLERVDAANFRVLLQDQETELQPNRFSYSYATDEQTVWYNAQPYAAYEWDARHSESLDSESRQRIVVENESSFYDSLSKIPGSNYYLHNSAVWYAHPLDGSPLRYRFAPDSVRGLEHTLGNFFVLEYVHTYKTAEDVEFYRCDYIRVGEHAFHEMNLLVNAEIESFRALGVGAICGFAKDANRLYYQWQEVDTIDVDVKTFNISNTQSGWGCDKYGHIEYIYRRYSLSSLDTCTPMKPDITLTQ